jgi:transposase
VVDEFKGDADKTKFKTIIVDVEKKEIIEVLPDRRVETLEKHLKDVTQVELKLAVKKAVQTVFDNPFIIADRFLFMSPVYWALDSVRREVQNVFQKEQRLKTKRSKKLLLMDPDKLDKKAVF